MSSLYIGFVTPGRLGEFIKAVYLKSDKGISLSKGMSSVLIDRLCDLYLLIFLGLLGSVAARYTYQLLRRIHEGVGLVAAGWLSVNASALMMALVLGMQPAIAHAEDGQPLFFPFGLSVTLPAVMVPHALIGIGEGVLTLLMFRLLRQRGWIAGG